jgi:serine/threonine-protein kinase
MAEVVIDALARTRGVHVQSSGATARFRSERDPRVVGRELGVGLVADGTLQSLGKSVRATLRLVDVASGIQIWSGRFEDSGEDVFALQDRLGRRMVESLRTELLIAPYREHVSPEAMALYRQSVAQVHSMPRVLPDEVMDPLDRCIAEFSGFLPALALHAVASMRTWFMRSTDPSQDWASVARISVDRAVRQAPDLPETLMAKGMMATQMGDWRTAVVSLRAALDVAPTFAGALQYLGSLQCEAGRADEGLERLRLAYEAEPNMAIALYEIARCSALRGRTEDYRKIIAQLMAYPLLHLPTILLRMRVASWHGDTEEVRHAYVELRKEPSIMARNAIEYAAAILGEIDLDAAMVMFDARLAERLSPRFASMMCQLAAEVLCLKGQPQRALPYLRRAADTALIDLEWIDRCPALVPLRAFPEFGEERLKVRTRVEAIWAV